MINLGTIETFSEHKRYQLFVENNRLLLIHAETGYFLIRDACGHFGVSLEKAECNGEEITCPIHGLIFSIRDGSVINRPWDNCVPLTVIPLIEQDGCFWVESIPE